MDWNRGFYRLWIAFSVLWIGLYGVVYAGLFGYMAFDWLVNGKLPQDLSLVPAIGSLAGAVAWTVLPPFVLLWIGRGVRWIVMGFRKQSKQPASSDGYRTVP
jgi:hypothetical protein